MFTTALALLFLVKQIINFVEILQKYLTISVFKSRIIASGLTFLIWSNSERD